MSVDVQTEIVIDRRVHDRLGLRRGSVQRA